MFVTKNRPQICQRTSVEVKSFFVSTLPVANISPGTQYRSSARNEFIRHESMCCVVFTQMYLYHPYQALLRVLAKWARRSHCLLPVDSPASRSVPMMSPAKHQKDLEPIQDLGMYRRKPPRIDSRIVRPLESCIT